MKTLLETAVRYNCQANVHAANKLVFPAFVDVNAAPLYDCFTPLALKHIRVMLQRCGARLNVTKLQMARALEGALCSVRKSSFLYVWRYLPVV